MLLGIIFKKYILKVTFKQNEAPSPFIVHTLLYFDVRHSIGIYISIVVLYKLQSFRKSDI